MPELGMLVGGIVKSLRLNPPDDADIRSACSVVNEYCSLILGVEEIVVGIPDSAVTVPTGWVE
jgi:hypothetical protein